MFRGKSTLKCTAFAFGIRKAGETGMLSLSLYKKDQHLPDINSNAELTIPMKTKIVNIKSNVELTTPHKKKWYGLSRFVQVHPHFVH